MCDEGGLNWPKCTIYTPPSPWYGGWPGVGASIYAKSPSWLPFPFLKKSVKKIIHLYFQAGYSEDAIHCCGPSWQGECCTAAELGLSNYFAKEPNSDDFRKQVFDAFDFEDDGSDAAWFIIFVPLMALTIIGTLILCCCCCYRVAARGGSNHHPPPPPPAQSRAAVPRATVETGAYQTAPLPPPAPGAAFPVRTGATVETGYLLEPKAGTPPDGGGNSNDEPPSYTDLYPSSLEPARQPAYNPYAT